MNIRFIPEAANDYKSLDGSIKKLANDKIDKLRENPFIGELLGNKNNIDLTGFYKIYFAKKTYRIVYRIVKNQIEIIEIWGIGKRDKMAIYKTVAKRISNRGENMNERIVRKVKFLGKDVELFLEPETDEEGVYTDIATLEELYIDFEKSMGSVAMGILIEQIADSLIEDMYQQDGEAKDGEAEALAKELKLTNIDIAADADGCSMNMLTFVAKSMPKAEIIAQLDSDYQIDDLYVEEGRHRPRRL